MVGCCVCVVIYKVKVVNCVFVVDFGYLVSVFYLYRFLGDKLVEKNFLFLEKFYDKLVVVEVLKWFFVDYE